VLFAHLVPDGPLAGLYAHLAAALGDVSATVFPSRDRALEYCEDALIAAAMPESGQSVPVFESFELFRGIDAAGLAKLRAIAQTVDVAAGEAFVREGSGGDAFFVLASGSASICSTAGHGGRARPLRLSTITPGTGFGERALIDGGARLADVVADEDSTAFTFPADQVRALGATDPGILIALLGNMAGGLAERLDVANTEIRALEG
jgi:CRP-like cAMP-binding protein